MKKLFIFFAVISLLFVACQPTGSGVEGADVVAVNLNVKAPLLVTRASTDSTNSRFGGITNVDWEAYDLRYTLCIYDTTGTNIIVEPQCFFALDQYSDAYFSFYLAPDQKYKFVLWADFVAENTILDNHFNTEDLKNITMKDEAVYDESRDAYYASTDVYIGQNGFQSTITLYRPFGKLRVVTSDMKYIAAGTAPKSAKIVYEYDRANSFDAVSGYMNNSVYASKEFVFDIDTARYKEGLDASLDSCTLFIDYIYAPKDTTQEIAMPFELYVYNDDKEHQDSSTLIRHIKLKTQIPIKRNRLTTLHGGVLTREAVLSIKLDEMFENDTTIYNLY